VLNLCFKEQVRLFVVGDPDQSIYGFTGARPKLLEELAERADVQKIVLPFNYRSASEIVNASEALLAQNRGFKAVSRKKGMIEFHYCPNGRLQQVQAIFDQIIPDALNRDPSRKIGEIAVLYLDKWDGELIATHAKERGIPFVRIDGGASLRPTPLTRWLQDCATWCAGGWKIATPKVQDLIHLWLAFSVDSRDEAQRRGEARKLTGFLFLPRNPAHPLRRWLEELEEKCLRSALIRGGMLRDEQETFQSLLGLTDKDAELSDATVASFAGQAGSPNNLNLITLHSAKGLEFDVVILLGMDQGRLPSWRVNSADGMAEARRLFYVGITRARHEVHLTYSGFREGTYGQIYADGPSIFLKEIQQRLQR
jgi:DNA helicase-2/ATP-dependent DNA helicase PcrA